MQARRIEAGERVKFSEALGLLGEYLEQRAVRLQPKAGKSKTMGR